MHATRPKIMLSFCAALVLSISVARANDIPIFMGDTVVHDGDELIIDGQHFRLHGIDAFEMAQQCRGGVSTGIACGVSECAK